VAIDPLGGSSVVISQQLQDATRKFLETFQGLAAGDGIKQFETVVRQGELFYRTILDEAVSRQAELIMIGRHESGFLKRVLFQSLTSQLLHYAPCPVLVVPLAALIGWKNIILAVNGDRSSEPALAEALKLGKEYGGKLTAAIKAPRRGSAEALSRRLQDAAAQAGLMLETVVITANAAEEIARLAKEREADMIITGQPEENILKHIFQGSLPEQIIDKSLCAVLVVPAVGTRRARTEPTIS
jgi:nucleotide-binding universal stress UspA family protein